MQTVRKVSLDQQSWDSGASEKATTYRKVNGKCEQIAVKISVNTNTVAGKVSIYDSNGGKLYEKTSIPTGTTTIYYGNSLGSTDCDFKSFLCDGKLTVEITPDGDPGTTGVKIDVDLYVR